MPITQYSKALRFLDALKEESGLVMAFDDFKIEIMKRIGSDKHKTLRPYMRLMLDTKLITVEGSNVRINR